MTTEDHSTRWRLFDDESTYIDRFGLLLAIASLAVITLSLVDLRSGGSSLREGIGQILVSLFVGATLVVANRASGVGLRYRRLSDVLVVIVIAATLVYVLAVELSGETFSTAANPSIVWVVLSLIAPVLVVRRLFKHRRVNAQTLAGAISAYLLIALAFCFAYLTVDGFVEGGFFGSDEPTTNFMYFSLVTITTLGYGDLSAAEPFGRLLTTMEAVIGQVYLVTIVAMIVGLMVSQRGASVD